MRACMDENGMKFDEGEVDELTRALFHDATVVTLPSSAVNTSQTTTADTSSADKSAASSTAQGTSAAGQSADSQAVMSGITFDALKAQLTKHDGLLQNLSISIDRWLVPPKPKKPATFMESIISKVRFFVFRA